MEEEPKLPVLQRSLYQINAGLQNRFCVGLCNCVSIGDVCRDQVGEESLEGKQMNYARQAIPA
eukprot:1161598-Pelagomonas_calceolata.AAC.11